MVSIKLETNLDSHDIFFKNPHNGAMAVTSGAINGGLIRFGIRPWGRAVIEIVFRSVPGGMASMLVGCWWARKRQRAKLWRKKKYLYINLICVSFLERPKWRRRFRKRKSETGTTEPEADNTKSHKAGKRFCIWDLTLPQAMK